MSSDRELLDRVAAAFDRVDGVPARLRRDAESAASRCRSGVAHRLVLLRDSAVAPRDAGVRGPGDGRLLRFGGGSLRMELDVESRRSVRLTGLLHARTTGWRIAVRWPSGEQPVPVDQFGRFTAEALPPGPLSLSLHHPTEASTATPWFVG